MIIILWRQGQRFVDIFEKEENVGWKRVVKINEFGKETSLKIY